MMVAGSEGMAVEVVRSGEFGFVFKVEPTKYPDALCGAWDKEGSWHRCSRFGGNEIRSLGCKY